METLLRGETSYYVMAGPNEVFQYMEGDFGTTSSLYKLSGFYDLSEAIRAQNYSLGRYHFGEIVKAYQVLVKVGGITKAEAEAEIKTHALSKLTSIEKKILGLEDNHVPPIPR